jgi:molecular chaperone DnaK
VRPVGIDLGTTFSAVAMVDDSGRPVVVPNDRGSPITPSVICFKDNEVIVGEEAKELQAIGHPTAAFFKRQMGQPHWLFAAADREYSATDLSALVLGKLKRDAEHRLGSKITEAIITVPAYFRNSEREATIAAGEKAGLKVLQVVNEPTAAAIAYGARSNANEQVLLVYDLGGGTFDVTLLRVDPAEIRVITSDGDHELGGKDWDDRIVQLLGRRFQEEFGEDPLSERESVSDLLIRAEEAKRRLSSVQTTRIAIVHGANRGNYELDRPTFEQLTRDLMERTISLTSKVLEDQKLAPADVNGVLLVGGSTRMPMVHDFIKRRFDRTPLSGVNVDEAVAIGAALLAAEGAGAQAPKTLALGPRRKTVDVTNHSLGMIAINETRSDYVNSIILPKNQPLPCVQSRPYQHRARRQSSLEVFITQGESKSPAEVSYLGRHTIHDVPPDPKGVTILDIEYSYDASGTVKVSASPKSTGVPLRITVDTLPSDVPARFGKPPEAQAVPHHVTAYLAFDLSGSMTGKPLAEAQKAARGFVANTDLAHCSIGIIGFSDAVRTGLTASQDARQIEQAIGNLTAGETGYGNADDPFDELRHRMGGGDGPRFAIVLADGLWDDQPRAVARARRCKESGIDVIAIGFGGADGNFLKAIASSDETSFFTSLGGLADTFCDVAQLLTETAGGMAPGPAATGKKSMLGFLRGG